MQIDDDDNDDDDEDNDNDNDPIIVLSGTSLITRLLGLHNNVSMLYNNDFAENEGADRLMM